MAKGWTKILVFAGMAALCLMVSERAPFFQAVGGCLTAFTLEALLKKYE
ncbi:MAG: hypothetical protein WC607_02790 [Candidatus Micrarchaeia archaeon]